MTPTLTHRAVFDAKCGQKEARKGVGKRVFFADVLYGRPKETEQAFHVLQFLSSASEKAI